MVQSKQITMQTTLSKNIIRLRKSKGLKQLHVADMIGVTRSKYQTWEGRGAEPDVKHLLALADFYGITVDKLLKGEDELKAKPEPIPEPIVVSKPVLSKPKKISDEEIQAIAIKELKADRCLSCIRSFSFTEMADYGIEKFSNGFKPALMQVV